MFLKQYLTLYAAYLRLAHISSEATKLTDNKPVTLFFQTKDNPIFAVDCIKLGAAIRIQNTRKWGFNHHSS